MRKFTLLALSALLACASEATAQTAKPQNKLFDILTKGLKVKHDKSSARQMTVRKANAAVGNSFWKATHEKEYMYNEDDATWEAVADYYLTYDQRGNILVDLMDEGEGMQTRRVSTYNENNKATSQIDEDMQDDGTFMTTTKRYFEYDSILTDVITKREAYDYDSDTETWYQSGNNYTRTITRDANGNITNEQIAVLYQGIYDPTQRITITYKDGKADTYKQEQLTLAEDGSSFVWETSIILKDIVWDKTNGQIVGDVSDLYEGDNAIKSATVCSEDDGEVFTVAYLTITRSDNGSYLCTMSMPAELYQLMVQKTYSDINGSYTYEALEAQDINGDGRILDEELISGARVVEQYDAQGNETLYEEYELNEETSVMELMGSTKNDYQYDEQCGAMSEMITYEYDTEAAEFVPMMKVVCDEFKDVANTDGISDVRTNNTTSAFYDLRGVRVGDSLKNLPRGIYIQKLEGKTIKVVKH